MSVKETIEGKEKTTEENSEETSQETESEETSTEDKVEKETLTPEEQEEQKEALQLYRSLKGPSAVKTLEGIAKSAGLELTGTKKEQKEQAKNVAEIFQDHLGEDYRFLAGKIGNALEQVIEQKLLPQVNSAKQSSVEQAVNGHLKEIYEEESIPKSEHNSIRSKMDELSVEIPYNGKSDLKIYLKRLYNTVIREDTKTRTRIEKINRNAEEDDGTSAEGSKATRVVKGPKNPTLRQAVEAAARGERWE